MKALYSDILYFSLPPDFNGKVSDALRLLADHLDGKSEEYVDKGAVPEDAQNFDTSGSFNDFLISVYTEFMESCRQGYRTINGLHIIDLETGEATNRKDEIKSKK